MKIYLAAWYAGRDWVRGYAAELRQAGIEVTSRWLEETHSPKISLASLPFEFNQQVATTDLEDIGRADTLILFTPDFSPDSADIHACSIAQWARGGRHFETGYAWALGKRIILCGPRENVFHWLDDVEQFDTWEKLKETLCSELVKTV